MSIFSTGLIGEFRACAYLKKYGMRILSTRYRAAGGEIDIIAREGETLAFIEVKYRPGGRLTEGLEAVTKDKQRRIKRAARQYISCHKIDAPFIRYDIIEITAAGIWYVKNALDDRRG
jgi:putative endonuclease